MKTELRGVWLACLPPLNEQKKRTGPPTRAAVFNNYNSVETRICSDSEKHVPQLWQATAMRIESNGQCADLCME
ncbi:hypothetical protein KIN20_035272 [Parelaphostrongylus tenuis]|uniref:Uncharacterized protein n=1 Tax=Parelaphostrongylus tenuis TaxID=148309 RepID=A0AAD5RAV7_PARTN|nr:hypothetical protein KIN20_035272 [Parelaphostrongylus tenuis]